MAPENRNGLGRGANNGMSLLILRGACPIAGPAFFRSLARIGVRQARATLISRSYAKAILAAAWAHNERQGYRRRLPGISREGRA